jgi:hypothetical protein
MLLLDPLMMLAMKRKAGKVASGVEKRLYVKMK